MAFKVLIAGTKGAKWVEAAEKRAGILISTSDKYEEHIISPNEARGLAKSLYRLARRIDARQ